MIGKIACLLAFSVTIIVVADPAPRPVNEIDPKNNRPHDLIVGHHVPGDHFVLRQRVFEYPIWNQIITVQRTFNASRYERITVVKVFDQVPWGRGAFASLVKGGPGTSNVTLHFQSQEGLRIDFIVELYAKP